jgi:uncharacterized protein YkwD
MLSGLEQELFDSHNQIRAANGLPPLALDSALTAIARHRAQDMATRLYFSHTAPNGETAFTLLHDAGIGYRLAAENIAYGTYPDSQIIQATMNGFMASAGHRENILEPRFQLVGVGVAQAANGTKYIAVVFIEPF